MLTTADLATTNLSSTSYVSAWAQGNCPCCYKLFPLLPNPGCPPPWSLYNHVNVNITKNLFHFCSDEVPALFEGWPNFKNRPWRRRSCELVKSSSSCVRKAVSHLHLLQDVLDTFYKSVVFETSESLRSKTRLSLASGERNGTRFGTGAKPKPNPK